MTENTRVFSISLPIDIAEQVERTAAAEGRSLSKVFEESFQAYRAAKVRRLLSESQAAYQQAGLTSTEDQIDQMVKEELQAVRQSKRGWAALIFKGTPGRAVTKAAAEYIIAMAKEIYGEVIDVLNRPKFATKVDPLSTVELLDSVLKESAEWFSLRGNVADCLDPKDNKFLDCALVAGASVIVSSDRHLRRMDPYHGIRILNPQEFLLL